MSQDTVGQFIEVKQQVKELTEKQRALETIIFADDNLRADDRIKIQAGRETIKLNDTAYESLESIGIETTVTETRRKDLKEFDISIQKALLENPNNYEKKVSKESIRIK